MRVQGQVFERQDSKRAGRKIIALNKANTASTLTQTKRKGNSTSQINGNKTSARSASGQLSTNKMHQNTSPRKIFIVSG